MEGGAPPLQPLLPEFDRPVLAPGPVFVQFELQGPPGHKGRHRSKLMIPADAWRNRSPTGKLQDSSYIPRCNVGKIFIQQYPDPKTESYEKVLALAARRFMGSRPPTLAPVALLVHSFREVPASWSKKDQTLALMGGILPTSRPDWDNYGKITDALNGIVWKDDSQVADGRVIKRYDAQPGLRIEVREFIVDQLVREP